MLENILHRLSLSPVTIDSRITRSFHSSTSTKVLYQYIDNIGCLQHQLLRLGLMWGTVRALTVVQ